MLDRIKVGFGNLGKDTIWLHVDVCYVTALAESHVNLEHLKSISLLRGRGF